MANTLVPQHSVSQVFICSLLTGTANLASLTPREYQERAYKVNHYLKTMAAGDCHITYHVHKGFWTRPQHSWSRDGVHPNTKLGRSKYIASLRNAIFLAVANLSQQSVQPTTHYSSQSPHRYSAFFLSLYASHLFFRLYFLCLFFFLLACFFYTLFINLGSLRCAQCRAAHLSTRFFFCFV